MGEVVLFRQSRSPRVRENDGAAQILFFTGVRYERMAEAPPPNNTRPSSNDGLGSKRKRKRG